MKNEFFIIQRKLQQFAFRSKKSVSNVAVMIVGVYSICSFLESYHEKWPCLYPVDSAWDCRQTWHRETVSACGKVTFIWLRVMRWSWNTWRKFWSSLLLIRVCRQLIIGFRRVSSGIKFTNLFEIRISFESSEVRKSERGVQSILWKNEWRWTKTKKYASILLGVLEMKAEEGS